MQAVLLPEILLKTLTNYSLIKKYIAKTPHEAYKGVEACTTAQADKGVQVQPSRFTKLELLYRSKNFHFRDGESKNPITTAAAAARRGMARRATTHCAAGWAPAGSSTSSFAQARRRLRGRTLG